MILLKNSNTGKTIELNPTVFPDGTSQVWKIEGVLDYNLIVYWYYEKEVELLHLMQLGLIS